VPQAGDVPERQLAFGDQGLDGTAAELVVRTDKSKLGPEGPDKLFGDPLPQGTGAPRFPGARLGPCEVLLESPGHPQGEVLVVDVKARLIVQLERAHVEVRGANSNELPVDDQELGV
jgi:hypothetical protein